MLEKFAVGMWQEISDNLKAAFQMILLILWVIRGKPVGFLWLLPSKVAVFTAQSSY